MRYTSTRGDLDLSFEDALFCGYAPDGGLLVPREIPDCTSSLKAWSKLSYPDLMFEILSLFISPNEVPQNELKKICGTTFSSTGGVFTSPEIVPVKQVNETLFVAELYHGPTLAFKDLALQLVGSLCQYFLSRSGKSLTVLIATSGDTGSAAIHGVKGKSSIRCFVLFPEGRISSIQEKQMTTVKDNNIHVIGMDCTSDDLDEVLKAVCDDTNFKSQYNISSLNSINVSRILIQTVHYFFAYFRAVEKIKHTKDFPELMVSVPTGAFGNGVAGVFSKLMGLPISKIIIGTNENDILSRFFESGTFKRGSVVKTISPSIDIQVPYNFERFIYFLNGQDSQLVCSVMQKFSKEGIVSFDSNFMQMVKKFILSSSVTDEETRQVIAQMWTQANYLIDPHTAVGVAAQQKLKQLLQLTEPVICLATAHAAKFEDVMHQILPDVVVPVPKVLEGILSREADYTKFSSHKDEAIAILKQMITQYCK
mmetsp:Transcript_15108/g.21081  ORF Transcript_15108/g.21081 Transcript_15108/m.21081 type:complete len:480 (-) Transcript_15108:24-1463(-)